MSFGDHRRSQPAYLFGAEPDAGRAVRITPNRHSIDNKFPVLGFTIHTGGLPFFEVLLTSDRSLFAPANAGRRGANNFYASRQDSGLIRATGTEAIYLAPPAVLRAFAQAEPRPSAIYYTLIAYRDADGSGPVFAQSPESLPTDAPSVTLAADFTGQTLSTVLGIPVEDLKPVYAQSPVQAAGEYSFAYSDADYAAGSAFSNGYQHDAESDAAEGEDGYGMAQSAYQEGWQDDEMESGYTSRQYGYDGESLMHDGEIDYRDGYEDDYGPVENTHAQESVFPAGASEPAPLGDDEQPYGEDLDDEISYGEDLDSAAFAGDESEGAYDDSAAFAYDEDVEYGYGAEAMESGLLHEDGYGYEEYGHETGQHDSHEASYETDYDGDEMALPFQSLDAPPPAAAARQPLTIDVKKRIIERIAKFESGRDGYSAINPDGEYEGRFGTGHPAYHRYHVGLSYGLIQFTQDSGLLGRLLVMMRQRDGQAFSQMFGGDPNTVQQLIDVTTASGSPSRKSPNGRSARVQPVGGADLWREPWLSRFRQAGQHVPFQAAQNQLAAEAFLDPMLRFAGWLGLDTERALAMVVDRAIQMGRGGAASWIISAVGPIQTVALRGQALTGLGYGDLRQFQRATPGLRDDGEFGPMTHAAMVAALRAPGAGSPIPIPTREQMMGAMVRAAAGRRWAHRVSELRQTGDLSDTPLQF
jgi:hypothetical protein